MSQWTMNETRLREGKKWIELSWRCKQGRKIDEEIQSEVETFFMSNFQIQICEKFVKSYKRGGIG